ncbi:MAG TPA: CHAP domain-containing protein [Candidatus Mediterraneibacter norwichensis]|nr:CHAP domain-containing protein [Candidatus Mediterraneibacter norwichensis]
MKVKRKLKALIAMLICMVTVLGSTMVSNAADNPYPTTQDWDGDGNYEVPCTRFAWQQVYDNLGIALPAWGNAVNWLDNARNAGYSTGNVARANSVAVWSGDGAGHVAYVTSASGNTFTVNEGGRTDLDHTSSHGVAYGYTLTNAVGEARPYDPGKILIGFIYFSDVPTVEVSLTWGNEDCQWDTTNAYMYAEADTNVSGSFTEAGITVWNEAGGVVASKSENPGITGTHLNVWYNITNDTGVVLEQGTNYTYQFYTVFNGTRYEGAVHSFRTNGPSVNSWTQELSISDWTYGQEASVPSASAKYGDVVYTYSTEENGEYTAEVPQSAGTYYVKASVAEAPDQYTGLEAIKEFHIYKAVPSYTVPENITATYGQTLADVTLDGRFVWMDNTQTVGDVGEKSFLATYVPEDSINYSFVNNIEIPVIVQPKDLSDMDLSGIDKDTDLNSYELKDGDTVLIKDTDYTITSVKDGDAVTVTVEFMGNYTGTAQTTYSLKDDSQIQTDNKNDNTDSSKNTDNKNADDTKTEKDSDDTKVPQTGDTSPIAVWAVMIALSGLAAGMVFKKRITDR